MEGNLIRKDILFIGIIFYNRIIVGGGCMYYIYCNMKKIF